ncbi:ATP-binding protein [Providencia rettgeri]|uniref:ATP-binding protein n=1 Tax=Providencia rettgeri TaxID=587 RepID=UPI001F12E741|nr:ATP-binding protein [Providencia rettgeri]
MSTPSPTAFSRITRTSGRTNSILTIAFPLLFILITTLIWSAERIVQQETKRLEVDFRSLIGYINEQEKFLRSLNKQNQDLIELVESRTYAIQEQFLPTRSPLYLLEGKESLVAMPFTLACDKSLECSNVPSILFSLGAYLADYYSTFWGGSYFPAAAVFFVNEHDQISISVPSVGTVLGNESISPNLYYSVIDSIRKNLPTIHAQFLGSQESDSKDIIWLRPEPFDHILIGIIPAGFDEHLWQNAHISPKNIYAVSMLSQARLSVLERMLNPTLTHQFWLIHAKYGQLLGTTQAPEEEALEGIFYTRDGLVLKLSSKTDEWTGYYRISYAAFFEDNLWLPISLVIALFFSLFCGWGYHRWYQQKILQPAIDSQQAILENESFNQTLIATTPIGLCVIDKETQQLRFANELARYWLKITNISTPHDSNEYNELLIKVLSDTEQVKTNLKSGEHVLYVVSTATYYQQRPVILCAFTDITIQAETEKQLDDAKRLAEEANRAKSTFLATMSHEIRTPLYGLIGTLELLANTSLSSQQAHFIDRISTTSQLLMQLIGDILDISKIEANQIQIHNQPFDLLELVQQTVQLYQGIAQQKGLLLFAIIDPNVQANRIGDSARLQQILGNLLSNAIKFTHRGTVTIELKRSNKNNILLRVSDTGVGISPEQQIKLFEPFYQAHSEIHAYGGTGLGLFICSKLIKLMDGQISLQSETGVGSSFLVTLPLALDIQQTHWLSLKNTNIWLQTPNPLLTENITQWLKRWGANVYFTENSLPIDTSSVIAVGILIPSFPLPTNWDGQQWVSTEMNFRLSELNQQLFLLQNNKEPIPLICPTSRIQTHMHKYPLRVLIAEDNPINQVVLQEQLELLGCKVFIANDGEEALVIWDNEIVDIILTDVNMPYRNGYELAQQLRSEGETCPIVGVTANGLKEEEERCLESGMDSWLVKPIELETLVQLFNRLFPIYSSSASEMGPIKVINPLNGEDREKIIRHFVSDITQFCQAVENNNTEELKQLSHRIRGALISVEQRELANQLREFETALDSRTSTYIDTQISQNICNQLANWIKKISQTNDV